MLKFHPEGLKTYTCNKFTGHYPVGVAAIVRAKDVIEATEKLNAALREQGLEGDAKTKNMILFPIGPLDDVRVLVNGDYLIERSSKEAKMDIDKQSLMESGSTFNFLWPIPSKLTTLTEAGLAELHVKKEFKSHFEFIDAEGEKVRTEVWSCKVKELTKQEPSELGGWILYGVAETVEKLGEIEGLSRGILRARKATRAE